MAKARDIPGLHPELPFAEAAARTVAVRASEIWEHADGVLDLADIERVHDMRVATRRLRAALEVYATCFPRRQLEPVLRDVKRLADALGARRDPDVQLATLQDMAGALGPAERPGIEAFGETVRARQLAGNITLAAALAEAQRTDLRGRLAALAGVEMEP
jgi:CHAD domain-containing protein